MLRAAGITLIEMLVALAVAAVLAGAATPLCRSLLLEARMTAAVNALVHGVHAARRLAHTQLRDAVVCRSMNGRQCAAPGDWSAGWIVYVNRDGDDPPAVDPGEPVVAAHEGPLPLAVTSNRRAFVVRPFQLRATNGTVVFCDARGPAGARAVVVSYTGRPRVTRQGAGGRPLACPA